MTILTLHIPPQVPLHDSRNQTTAMPPLRVRKQARSESSRTSDREDEAMKAGIFSCKDAVRSEHDLMTQQESALNRCVVRYDSTEEFCFLRIELFIGQNSAVTEFCELL